MEAYLDNSATTRCCEEAAQLVVKLLTEDYGNPSSLHNKGVIAENYMNDARKKIAKTLKVQEKEIYFTSGGTESDNQAIISAAMLGEKQNKKHIISTAFEHHAVLHTLRRLKEQGFEIQLLDVGAEGNITADEYMEKLDGFVSRRTRAVMALRNQAGLIGLFNETAKNYK